MMEGVNACVYETTADAFLCMCIKCITKHIFTHKHTSKAMSVMRLTVSRASSPGITIYMNFLKNKLKRRAKGEGGNPIKTYLLSLSLSAPHLALRQRHSASNIGCASKELRSVSIDEGGMPTTLLLQGNADIIETVRGRVRWVSIITVNTYVLAREHCNSFFFSISYSLSLST